MNICSYPQNNGFCEVYVRSGLALAKRTTWYINKKNGQVDRGALYALWPLLSSEPGGVGRGTAARDL